MLKLAPHWLLILALLFFTASCGNLNNTALKNGKQLRISESDAKRLLKSPLQGDYLCSTNIRTEISFSDFNRTGNDINFKSRVRVYKPDNQIIDTVVPGHFNIEIGVLLIESKTTYDSWPIPNKYTLVLGRDLAGKGWEGYVEDSQFETCYKAAFTSQGGYTTSELPVDSISPTDAFETAVQPNEVRYPWQLYTLEIAARHGDITARNYLTVFSHLLNQAQQGDITAFNKLGDLYNYGDLFQWYVGTKSRHNYNFEFAKEYGIYKFPGYIQEKVPSNGLPKNPFLAAFWYHKGAEHGSLISQMELGNFYHNLTMQDDVHAMIWYRKAADQGNAEGQYNLGYLYIHGKGIKLDFKTGAQWIQKSAEQGNPNAQAYLATLYEFGVGVPKDFAQAAVWYSKASDKNIAWAQYHLGLLYYKGEGVTQNYATAIQWFHKAVDNKDYEAAKVLGKMYQDGIGVKQDSKLAAYWYQQSVTPGQRSAAIMSNILGAMADAAEENEYRRDFENMQRGINGLH